MMWSYLREHVIRRAQHSVIVKLFKTYFGGHIIQTSVALVKLGGYKSMDDNLGSLEERNYLMREMLRRW